jgi:hypothetical protein
MGLDMYLEIRRDEYVSHYTKSKTIKNQFAKFITENGPNLKGPGMVSRKTLYEVGYWRKANQIHNWFMENCAPRDYDGDPVDDCRPIEVSVEQLEDLLKLCKRVLADHSLASTLLPTKSGFFFGTTEYDEYYFKDLEDTIEIIEPVIEFMHNIKDKCKSNDWYDVVYTASW